MSELSQLLVFTSVVLFILSYFIGVKKYTWLLSGFNEKRVKNKGKLARLVGIYCFCMGAVMGIGAFIEHPNTQILFPIMVIGFVTILGMLMREW